MIGKVFNKLKEFIKKLFKKVPVDNTPWPFPRTRDFE